MASQLGVTVLGAGPLAAEVTRIIRDTGSDLRARIAAPLVLEGADPDLVVDTTDSADALPPVLDALRAGRAVITANAALVAHHSHLLATTGETHGGDLYFEAAVAGGVPVVRPLTQSLSGDRVRQLLAVLPDDHMVAQAAILATLAFHTRVEPGDVHREAFGTPSAHDLAAAASLGLRPRLLTVCALVSDAPGPEHGGKQRISVRVAPALLPTEHPLTHLDPAVGAVAVTAEGAGPLMFSGGSGVEATASALLGDLVTAARNRVHGARAPRASTYAELPLAPLGDCPTRYYVNLHVTDHAGALAQVAATFADHGVGIARVRQELHDTDAHLIVLTHRAPESALADTVDALIESPCVRAVTTRWRVEGTQD
ncbi:ACT domain-containing protein [Nocardia sp. AG03]|uniref:ACT domain-containing protein n=1 Tax=Nocardia sp. AG03 TaxID=3025312 RepID=UPI00241821E1|nr:ACT domain-containing protein [Nocardia sp. AG03]